MPISMERKTLRTSASSGVLGARPGSANKQIEGTVPERYAKWDKLSEREKKQLVNEDPIAAVLHQAWRKTETDEVEKTRRARLTRRSTIEVLHAGMSGLEDANARSNALAGEGGSNILARRASAAGGGRLLAGLGSIDTKKGGGAPPLMPEAMSRAGSKEKPGASNKGTPSNASRSPSKAAAKAAGEATDAAQASEATGTAQAVEGGDVAGVRPSFDKQTSHDSIDISPGGSKVVRRRMGEKSKKLGDRHRRWSVQLQMNEDDIASPKWTAPAVRKTKHQLDFDGKKDAEDEEGNEGKEKKSKLVCNDPAADRFVELGQKLQHYTGQTNMRMNNYIPKIKEIHHQDPTYLTTDLNFEKLVDICYLIATVTYRLGKWLHELEPRKVPKPTKPSKPNDERSANDLLSEVTYSLSRMEVLASTLAPVLVKIANEAINTRKTADGEPISPTSRNPVKLAAKKGITDTEAFTGIAGHLENLLQTAHSLAYQPIKDPAKKVRAGIKAILAIQKFKTRLEKRRKRLQALKWADDEVEGEKPEEEEKEAAPNPEKPEKTSMAAFVRSVSFVDNDGGEEGKTEEAKEGE
eukprot:TRINITY_DN4776_c0_g1_i1.p1 TRINITY_DN4776_c0_g1~~TRINITY_DN4776_c0_g1_i1.p1  ORF type:complete len:580 (+),score=183.58 TRINITY_DN4776_c0_g1_i1:146-1885(+)